MIKIIRSLSFTNSMRCECTQCIVYLNYTQPHIDFKNADSNETLFSYELVKVNVAVSDFKNHINFNYYSKYG